MRASRCFEASGLPRRPIKETKPNPPHPFHPVPCRLRSPPLPRHRPPLSPPLLRRIFPAPRALARLPTYGNRRARRTHRSINPIPSSRRGEATCRASPCRRCCDASSSSAVSTTTATDSARSPPPRLRRPPPHPPPPPPLPPSRSPPRRPIPTTSHPTEGPGADWRRSSPSPRSHSPPRARSTSPLTTSRRRCTGPGIRRAASWSGCSTR